MTFALAGSVITQSGTDTTLSGISGVAGVTTLVDGPCTRYDIGSLRLVVSGTLTIAATAIEQLAFSGDATNDTTDISVTGTLNVGSEQSNPTDYIQNAGYPAILERRDSVNDSLGNDSTGLRASLFISGSGTCRIFGSIVTLRGGFGNAGGTTLQINDSIVSCSSFYPSGNHSITRSAIRSLQSTNPGMFPLSAGSYSGMTRYGGAYVGLSSSSPAGTYTMRDTPTLQTGAALMSFGRTAAGGVFNFINSLLGSAYTYTTVAGRYYEASQVKECLVTFKTPAGVAVAGASVWIRGKAGMTPVTATTDASGSSGTISFTIATATANNGTLTYTYNSVSNDSTDDFTYKVRSFAHVFIDGALIAKGNGVLTLTPVALPDTRVAAADKAAALAVAGIAVSSTTITITANVTAQQVFDYCKAWLVDNPAEADFLPAALNFGSQNITINNATMTMGGLVTTGTVSLAGTGAASGPYTDAAGLHVNIRADSLLTGSRVQLYNVTDATELLNTETTGAGLVFPIIAPATAKTIRLRVAKVGYLPIEAFGVLDGASVSFLDSQAADAVYNAIGIDGSTVTEFLPDYPNLQIDANDADGITTVQRVYAWSRWTNTTADGIRLMHNAVQAQDSANYLIDTAVVDAKFDNNSATPLVINGGYIRRSDGLTVIGEGAIQLDPGRAYVAAGATAITVPAGERVVTLASGGFLARG